MSAFCQKRTHAVQERMSAKGQQQTSRITLFNHLVGAADECLRYRQAKFFGGLQIDDKLDLVGLLDGKLGGLFALENPAGVNPDSPIHIGGAGAVTHES